MNRVCVLFALMLVACSTTRESIQPTETIELVRLSLLPPLPYTPPFDGLKLVVLFGVRADGTVGEAELLRGSNDRTWNKDAMDSLRTWRFVPAAESISRPLRWIRDTVIIRTDPPVWLHLGRLFAGSQHEADSLHELLLGGTDFSEMAARSLEVWPDGGSWFCRSANLCVIPPHIREAVRELKNSEFTRPVRFGAGFAIYRRFGDAEARRVLHPS